MTFLLVGTWGVVMAFGRVAISIGFLAKGSHRQSVPIIGFNLGVVASFSSIVFIVSVIVIGVVQHHRGVHRTIHGHYFDGFREHFWVFKAVVGPKGSIAVRIGGLIGSRCFLSSFPWCP